MNIRKLLSIIFVASLLFQTNAYAEEKETIKVGVILPLSGGFGFFGEQARQGITAALDEINAGTGPKVEALFEDDKCLPRDATTAFKKLTEIDKVDFILGPACSGAILGIAPLIERSGRHVLALLDSGDKVRKVGPKLYAFGFDSEEGGRKMASYVSEQGHKRVGVLYEVDAWAELVTNSFVRELEGKGGSISVELSQAPDTGDYRPNILRLSQTKPDALYIVPAYNGGLFLKQLREMKSTLPVYGPDTFAVNEVFEIAGKSADGTICSNAYVDESSEAAKRLRASIVKKTGSAPHSLLYPSMGYDGMRMAYRALTSGMPFGKAMSTMNYDDGIVTVRGFDEDGMADLEIGIFQISKGEFDRIG